MITTWGHDPGIVPVSNVLLALNDALSHSAVLVQVSLEPISMETEGLLPSAVLLLFKPKYRRSWVVEKEQSSFPVIASLDQKRNFSAWEKQRPAFTGYLLPPKSPHSGLLDLSLCSSLSNAYRLPTVVTSPSSWRTLLESFQTINRLPKPELKGALLLMICEIFHTLIVFVFLLSQAHGVHTEGEVVYVPFPLDCKYGEGRKYMWIITNNAVIEDKESAQFY